MWIACLNKTNANRRFPFAVKESESDRVVALSMSQEIAEGIAAELNEKGYVDDYATL